MVLLRPGVWHGYEDCADLDLYNCCFSTELLQRELAWTREDPLLGYLLWTGPYSGAAARHPHHPPGPGTPWPSASGICDGLRRAAACRLHLHRGDIVGRLSLFLSCLARAVAATGAVGRAARPIPRC